MVTHCLPMSITVVDHGIHRSTFDVQGRTGEKDKSGDEGDTRTRLSV
jgi:hypothetical protein